MTDFTKPGYRRGGIGMTQKHDYKAALDGFYAADALGGHVEYMALQDKSAIIHALKLAHKLEQEPSQAMANEMINEWDSTGGRTVVDNFKAMIEQAKKEIE